MHYTQNVSIWLKEVKKQRWKAVWLHTDLPNWKGCGGLHLRLLFLHWFLFIFTLPSQPTTMEEVKRDRDQEWVNMAWAWIQQASANEIQEWKKNNPETHRPGSTEQSWCEFAGHSQSHMGEKRLRTALRCERKNVHNQQEELQISHKHQKQTKEKMCVLLSLEPHTTLTISAIKW